MRGFVSLRIKKTQIGRHGGLQKFPRGQIRIFGCGAGAGCGANSPMNNLIIGVVAQPIRSRRATSDLHGNRRATLTHGFVKNTIGRPAYSFPSDSTPSMHGAGAGAKLDCFLSHCSTPKRGWFANTRLANQPPPRRGNDSRNWFCLTFSISAAFVSSFSGGYIA